MPNFARLKTAIMQNELKIRFKPDCAHQADIEISADGKNWVEMCQFLNTNDWYNTLVGDETISRAEQEAVYQYVKDAGPYDIIKKFFNPAIEFKPNNYSQEYISTYLKMILHIQSAFNKARIKEPHSSVEVYRNLHRLENEIVGQIESPGAIVQSASIASTTTSREIYSSRAIKLIIGSGSDAIPLAKILDPDIYANIINSEQENFLGIKPIFVSKMKTTEIPESKQILYDLTHVTKKTFDLIIKTQRRFKAERNRNPELTRSLERFNKLYFDNDAKLDLIQDLHMLVVLKNVLFPQNIIRVLENNIELCTSDFLQEILINKLEIKDQKLQSSKNVIVSEMNQNEKSFAKAMLQSSLLRQKLDLSFALTVFIDLIQQEIFSHSELINILGYFLASHHPNPEYATQIQNLLMSIANKTNQLDSDVLLECLKENPHQFTAIRPLHEAALYRFSSGKALVDYSIIAILNKITFDELSPDFFKQIKMIKTEEVESLLKHLEKFYNANEIQSLKTFINACQKTVASEKITIFSTVNLRDKYPHKNPSIIERPNRNSAR